MKNKSNRWLKFFETLIYTILLTLPILNVFVRSIYVQNNDNAKDSYYGDTINDTTYTNIDDITDLKAGNTYLLSTGYFDIQSDSNIGSWAYFMEVKDVSIIYTDATLPTDAKYIDRISFYYHSSYGTRPQKLFHFTDGTANFTFNQSQNFECTFNYISNTFNYNWLVYPIVYELSYNDYSYLDNVFEYSLSKTIDDYGIGNINFVNWFGTLFFDDVTNLLYFNFVNMYLNYSLLVTLGYFIWFVFHWFITWLKELMYSFIYKDDKE